MASKINAMSCDVLIIGAGGAGLRAAIEAHDGGASVVILSKSLLGKAHTVMAEGGIAASVANVDSKDNWKVHFSDTVVEGGYIGDWRMIEKLTKEAPDRVYELEHYGALFDRTPEGKIMQRAFGAHTYRRLCHVGDKTGLELIRTLQDQILHREIKILDELYVTKLIVKENSVKGAIGFSMRTGEFFSFACKAVIIATGGAGMVYRVTSNSWESTGDGMALAYEAGAALKDMEMVQFHPTGMVYPPGVKGLLVTEGVRGEGGYLYNKNMERFMLKYSPERKELDARDVVARAIYNEITQGRGTEHNAVYLDIKHKGAQFILKKLPAMYTQFKDFAGIDITKEMMEVAPTVHYFMGGIEVDPESSATSVAGLYAAGEAAAGVHGANRLGGNSLADILVFGRQAGRHAGKYALSIPIPTLDDKEVDLEVGRIMAFTKKENGINPNELIDTLRDTMSEHVGIIRNENDLKSALSKIEALNRKYKDIYAPGGVVFNHGLLYCMELKSMLTIAQAIVLCAIWRKESRGAHTRSDYPKKDITFRKNSIVRLEKGNMVVSYKELVEMPKHLSALVKEEEYK